MRRNLVRKKGRLRAREGVGGGRGAGCGREGGDIHACCNFHGHTSTCHGILMNRIHDHLYPRPPS